MSALQTFDFESNAIRVLMQDEIPWFVAADVCRTLALTNVTMALQSLDADERAKLNLGVAGCETNIINESGLYTLILRSRDAVTLGTLAHRFRKWVTAEVLPAIRRNGHFALAGVMDDDPPASKDERVWGQSVAKVNAAARLINVAERIYGPEAARALWEREKGLPKLGKLTVAAIIGKPDDDPLGCWKHLMRTASGPGRTMGQLLDLALHDRLAAKALNDYGLAFVSVSAGGFLAIANRNRFLSAAFASTQWAEDWRLALARLPGAQPSKSCITFGDEQKCRAVLIPRAEVTKLRNPIH